MRFIQPPCGRARDRVRAVLSRSARTALAAAVSAVLVLGWALLAPGAALAGKGVVGYVGNPTAAPGTLGGQFGTLNSGIGGVAVNDTTGDVYVVDRANNRIEQFDASRTFKQAWGWGVTIGAPAGFQICTVAANCKAGVAGAGAGQLNSPQGVAVDQTTGNVVVTDQSNRRVDVFTANGTFVQAFGWGVADGTTAALQTCTTVCKAGIAGSGAGQFGTLIGYPAVDAAGNVYVADPANGRVQQFTAAGAFVRAFGWGVADGTTAALQTCTTLCKAGIAGSGIGQFASGQPTRVAVDATGGVYTVEASGTFRVQRFAPDATSATVFASTLTTGTAATSAPTDVAVNRTTGHVFVTKANPSAATGTPERQILELDALGLPVDVHLAGAGITPANGLAVSATTNRLFLTSPFQAQRLYLVDTVVPPVATIGAVTAVGVHTATLNGTVNASGGLPTTYRFEVSMDGTTWTPFPAPDATSTSTTAPQNVSQPATGLQAATTYRVRLVATRQFAGAKAVSAEQTFTTQGSAPEVTTLPAQSLRSTTAIVRATVNANNAPTTYRFEWGLTADYGHTVEGTVGPGARGTATTVSQTLTGLSPGTLYHVRAVASNGRGETDGADVTFLTRADVPVDARGVPQSPGGRAYEEVTPPKKSSRRANGIGDALRRVVPGVPSPNGDSMLWMMQYGSLADPAGSFAYDPNRFVRDPEHGWQTQPVVNVPIHGAASFATISLLGASSDQSVQGWVGQSAQTPFAEQVPWASVGLDWLRLMGADPDWATPAGWGRVPGWATWNTEPGAGFNFSQVLVSDDDRYAVATGPAGVMGPSDPTTGSYVLETYRRDLRDGTFDLVGACTGTGAAATQIPLQTADGMLGAQPCPAGTPTSPGGAVAGAGSLVFGLNQPLGGGAANAVSTDGQRVFFLSPDPRSYSGGGCGPGTDADTACPPQLYVRQYDANGVATVRWISRPQGVGDQTIAELGDGVSYEGASADGSKVFFRTNAPLLPTDPNGGNSPTDDAASPNSWDLYEYDLPTDPAADPGTGTLTRISGGPTGTADPNTNCASSDPIGGVDCDPNSGGAGGATRYVSADGNRVYFVTAGPIGDPSDPWNRPPAGSAPGNVPGGSPTDTTARNLYLYDATKSGDARWQFVARLPASTETLDGCASIYPSPGPALMFNTGGSGAALMVNQRNCLSGTADGRAIAFMTSAALTADDGDTAFDVYAYDEDANRLTRVTAPEGGAGGSYPCFGAGLPLCNGDLGLAASLGGGGADELARGVSGMKDLNIARNDDGTFSVFFETRSPLVAGDTNGDRMDVYEWRAGHLDLVSPGSSDDDAFLSGTSRDGRDVFFATAQPIDPREIDPGDTDIYDARRGGGFPPDPPPPAPCSGTACQGAPRTPPAEASAQSTAAGPGNTVAPAPTHVVPTLRLGAITASARRKLATSGRLTLTVTARGGGGRVTAQIAATIDGGSRLVATARRSIPARGGSARLTLALAPAARSALARHGRLKVTVSAALPGARTVKTAFTLKRAAARSTTRKHG